MYAVIMFFHVLICIMLIVVVLMQQTKGAGISSVFGGGGTESLFGGKGATPFFVRLTSGLAIGFFVTSLTLVLLSRRGRPTTAVEKGIQEMPMQQGVPEEQPVIPEEGTIFPEETPGGE